MITIKDKRQGPVAGWDLEIGEWFMYNDRSGFGVRMWENKYIIFSLSWPPSGTQEITGVRSQTMPVRDVLRIEVPDMTLVLK